MSNKVTPIDPTTTLRELVARDARVEAVLTRYGMDSCCGSAIPLAAAAQRHGIPLEELTEALSAALDG